MLASYLAKQYAMYALANQYQQQSGNLVIPSVCFQSTARIDHPDLRTITSGVSTINQSGHSSGQVVPLETTKRPKIKQTSQSRKEMSSEIKFSIDRILAKSDSDDSSKDIGEDVDEAGDAHVTAESLEMAHYAMGEDMKFSWLNCTRYKPPKLQRASHRKGIHDINNLICLTCYKILNDIHGRCRPILFITSMQSDHSLHKGYPINICELHGDDIWCRNAARIWFTFTVAENVWLLCAFLV